MGGIRQNTTMGDKVWGCVIVSRVYQEWILLTLLVCYVVVLRNDYSS